MSQKPRNVKADDNESAKPLVSFSQSKQIADQGMAKMLSAITGSVIDWAQTKKNNQGSWPRKKNNGEFVHGTDMMMIEILKMMMRQDLANKDYKVNGETVRRIWN